MEPEAKVASANKRRINPAPRAGRDKVHDAVEYLVTWGLDHRVLGPIRAIGVDEIQRGKGHKYLTLVYQIDLGCTRLLWIGKERTVKTFKEFFTMIGPEVSAKIEFVCSDMWKPYLGVIREKCSQALNILDRFHIVAKVNQALDDIRSAEARRMKGDGYEPVLTKSRWCLLKRPANLTANQKVKLKDLVRYNLQSVRAYLLKEDFQQLWKYESTAWAAKFLDQWCRQVMRSRIEPMKRVAKTLRAHRELILNYFRARKQFSSGVIEGLNNKAKSHYEKILRVPNLPCHRTGALSLTWQAARAGTHPQIFLTNPFSFCACDMNEAKISLR